MIDTQENDSNKTHHYNKVSNEWLFNSNGFFNHITKKDLKRLIGNDWSNVNKVLHFLDKKDNQAQSLAQMIILASLISIIIPSKIYLPFLIIFGAVAVILWSMALVAMIVNTSRMLFRAKLTVWRLVDETNLSREQMTTKIKHTYSYLIDTNALLMTSCIDLTFNFFVIPLVFGVTSFGLSWLLSAISKMIVVASMVWLHKHLVNQFVETWQSGGDSTYINQAIQEMFTINRYDIKPLAQLLHANYYKKTYEPNLLLGQSVITGANIYLPVSDRRNATLVCGANGTGKSASMFEQWLIQDIKYFIIWLRKYYGNQIDKDNYHADKYLNSIIVIDTSNALCRTVSAIATKVFHIPNNLIHWLDVSNPNSDTFNLMRGQADRVTGIINEVITVLSEGEQSGNNYFSQAQKSWLGSFIKLIKLSSVLQINAPTFYDLCETCNNINEIDDYLPLLNKYIEILDKMNLLYYTYAINFPSLNIQRNFNLEQEIENLRMNSSDDNAFIKVLNNIADESKASQDYYEEIVSYAQRNNNYNFQPFISSSQVINDLLNYHDDQDIPLRYDSKVQNFHTTDDVFANRLTLLPNDVNTNYQSAKFTKTWFDNNILRLNKNEDSKVWRDFENDDKLDHSFSKDGNTMYIDRQTSSVKGLKNILSELTQDTYLGRVLFNTKANDNFNIEQFYKNGGIFLFYTGKGTLSDTNSRMLASIIQDELYTFAQTRSTRGGKPNAPLCCFYNDEAVDYMTLQFKDMPAQLRKFNISLNTAIQSLAQLSQRFNKEFTDVLLTTCRNKFVMNDSDTDAELFSKIFGTHLEYNMTNKRTSEKGNNNTYAYSEVPNTSANDLMAQQKYTVSCRINDNNDVRMFDRYQTHELDFNENEIVDETHNKYVYENFAKKYALGNETNDKQVINNYNETISTENFDFQGISRIVRNYFLRYLQAVDDKNRTDEKIYNKDLQTYSADLLKQSQETSINIPDIIQNNLVNNIHDNINGIPKWIYEILDSNNQIYQSKGHSSHNKPKSSDNSTNNDEKDLNQSAFDNLEE